MKLTIIHLIYVTLVLEALPLFGQSTAVVSRSVNSTKGVSYKYKITNKFVKDGLVIRVGDSCELGMILPMTESKIENEKVAVIDVKGDWIPNMTSDPSFATTVENDPFRSVGVFQIRPLTSSPLIPINSSKEFEFFVVEGNNESMLNMPICISTGGKQDISLIASEEEWESADSNFNLKAAYDSCESSNPPIRTVDPTTGDSRHQCTDKKYSLQAKTTRIQFLCVLEKRLQNRIDNVDLNKDLILLREKSIQNPKNSVLAQKVVEKKDTLISKLQTEVGTKNNRISELKSKNIEISAAIDKTCKE